MSTVAKNMESQRMTSAAPTTSTAATTTSLTVSPPTALLSVPEFMSTNTSVLFNPQSILSSQVESTPILPSSTQVVNSVLTSSTSNLDYNSSITFSGFQQQPPPPPQDPPQQQQQQLNALSNPCSTNLEEFMTEENFPMTASTMTSSLTTEQSEPRTQGSTTTPLSSSSNMMDSQPAISNGLQQHPVPSTIDAQKSAQALAQLLRSADGIKRLNSLRPEERAELAAKVNAFQKQLQQSGGTKLNAASLAVAALLANKLQGCTTAASRGSPELSTVSQQPRVSSGSQRPISTNALVPQISTILQAQHIQPSPPRSASSTRASCLPSDKIQGTQKIMAQKSNTLTRLSQSLGSSSAAHQLQQVLSQLPTQQRSALMHSPQSGRIPPTTYSRPTPSPQQLLLTLLQQPKQETSFDELPKLNEEAPLVTERLPLQQLGEKSVKLDDQLLQRIPPHILNILKSQKILNAQHSQQSHQPPLSSSIIYSVPKRPKEITLHSVQNHEERLRLDQQATIAKALKRRKMVQKMPNSVEAQVWRTRKKSSDFSNKEPNAKNKITKIENQKSFKIKNGVIENENLKDTPNATTNFCDAPLWDGRRFFYLKSSGLNTQGDRVTTPSLENVSNSNPSISVSQAKMNYWWDNTFDDEDITDSCSQNKDVPPNESDIVPSSTDSNTETIDGILEHPLDICILPDEGIFITPMYPPSLLKGSETKQLSTSETHITSSQVQTIAYPADKTNDTEGFEVLSDLPLLVSENQKVSLWIPKSEQEELLYAKIPNPPDRLLQEVLRGKWHLTCDLMSPIPVNVLAMNKIYSPGQSEQQTVEQITSSGRIVRSTRRAGGPYYDSYDFYYSPTRKTTEYEEADYIGLPPTKKLRRSGARTPQYSPYRDSSPPMDTNNLQSIRLPNEEHGGGSTPALVSGNVTPRPPGGYSSLDAEIDAVKRKTGWHPYVWYLMCRRPELYDIDIRARLVARVAGWEWDELQKSPETLRIFLDRIWQFVEQHPIPRYTDKKEAKEYKNFAATNVRTPWNGLETAAVRRALREMATSSTAGDSDSIASDGGISTLSTGGQQTPTNGLHTPIPLDGPAYIGVTGKVVERVTSRFPQFQLSASPLETISNQRSFGQGECLPSLVAKIISSTNGSSVQPVAMPLPLFNNEPSVQHPKEDLVAQNDIPRSPFRNSNQIPAMSFGVSDTGKSEAMPEINTDIPLQDPSQPSI